MAESCGLPVNGNRRTFWTLQPCRTDSDNCGDTCSSWGLSVGENGTIKTTDWLRSLIVSILGTDARKPDNVCGYRPGARAGHWSDSYRNGRYPGTVGTSIRDLTSHGRIADAVQELRAYAQHDLQKLITYGVANRVEVNVTYKGANTTYLEIIVYGQGDADGTRVGMNVTRIANAWVWDT